jgi:hypothetical protein
VRIAYGTTPRVFACFAGFAVNCGSFWFPRGFGLQVNAPGKSEKNSKNPKAIPPDADTSSGKGGKQPSRACGEKR